MADKKRKRREKKKRGIMRMDWVLWKVVKQLQTFYFLAIPELHVTHDVAIIDYKRDLSIFNPP